MSRDTTDTLTIYEVEPEECSIGESPVVDRLSRSYNLIPERDQITHCRARTDVLQVPTNRSPLTPLRVHGHPHFGILQRRVEVLHLFVTEIGSDGYIETTDRSPLPKGKLLFERSEARYGTGATDRVNVMHLEVWRYAYEV